MTEEWFPLAGYIDSYEITRSGQIRLAVASSRNSAGYLLTPGRHSGGYVTYHLVRNGRWSRKFLHRLLAVTFLGEPTGPMVRHLDGNPANNAIDNLAYGSARDNVQDAIRHGTFPRNLRVGGGPRPKSHCGHGHEMTPENTQLTKQGWRRCRTCHRDRSRAFELANPRSRPHRDR